VLFSIFNHTFSANIHVLSFTIQRQPVARMLRTKVLLDFIVLFNYIAVVEGVVIIPCQLLLPNLLHFMNIYYNMVVFRSKFGFFAFWDSGFFVQRIDWLMLRLTLIQTSSSSKTCLRNFIFWHHIIFFIGFAAGAFNNIHLLFHTSFLIFCVPELVADAFAEPFVFVVAVDEILIIINTTLSRASWAFYLLE